MSFRLDDSPWLAHMGQLAKLEMRGYLGWLGIITILGINVLAFGWLRLYCHFFGGFEGPLDSWEIWKWVLNHLRTFLRTLPVKSPKIFLTDSNEHIWPMLLVALAQIDWPPKSMVGSNISIICVVRLVHGWLSVVAVRCLAFSFRHFTSKDIKPSNFVLGPKGQHDKIFIVDFGLAKRFRDEDGRHIPMVKKSGMTGTARYTTATCRWLRIRK